MKKSAKPKLFSVTIELRSIRYLGKWQDVSAANLRRRLLAVYRRDKLAKLTITPMQKARRK